ncbi:hypothetical protein WH240_05005 [Gluconobacter wancherniae]|uniref:hypothetical protein n=1 Tax=Gluconobacter wancherniae TaxID=1307955 RepID=UPI0030A37016
MPDDDDNVDAPVVVSEPKKRGRPTKHGKAMSNNERQKKRQALTNGVFNAVIELSSKIGTSSAYSQKFDNDNFNFDSTFSSTNDINVNNIISLLPNDLQEEFKSRVRANIAKRYFSRDLSVYKNIIENHKSLHDFSKRFRDIYLWEIVHGAMHIRHKYDNPTKRAIEAIPFLLDFNNSHEQKYVDAYIQYRLIYQTYWNGVSRISLEKKDTNKEYNQSEKSHITRIANMRKDIIDFEKSNRKKIIKYGNELDNDIFYEQILHDVMILDDDAIKIRHKEIKRTPEIVINENTVAPISEPKVSKHNFDDYSDEMISAIKVLSDINDIKVDKSEPKPTEFSEDDSGLILLSTFDMYFIQNANTSDDFKRKAMHFWQTVESIKMKISIIRPKNQTDYALRVRQYLRNKSINDIHEINKIVSVIQSNATKLTKDDLKEFHRWYINYVNNKNTKEDKRDALGELIIIPDFDD